MSWPATLFPAMQHEALFGDRVVPCFRDRPVNFHQLLTDSATRVPDGEAVVMGDIRLTWSLLAAECDRIAHALAANDVGPGDRVMILMNNAPGFLITLLAVARLGAISVPFSVRASAEEVGFVLDDSGTKAVVHDGQQDTRLPAGSAATFHKFSELTGNGTLPDCVSDEQEPAFIVYTSGTTGRPKGAVLAHINIVHAALYYEAAMQVTSNDRIIAAVPLNHVTGIAALIATSVRAGACLILMDVFKTRPFLDLAEAERMTYTLMVPAMYNLCLLQPEFANRSLGAWRLAAYGGAPMPEPTIRKLAAAIPGLQFANCYGATETIVAQLITPPEFAYDKREYVGCPLPGTTTLIMDADGVEVPTGTPGELWLSGPNVVRGYWGNADATAKAFQGGYWKSGDIGLADADGFVKVLDRAKDMVNRGGLKIYSAELENVLTDHPDVAEAAIIARPCPVLGERVHAVIVMKSDVDQATLSALCAERLSDYKVPETWTLTSDPLPRNPNGKVDKKVLRKQVLATLGTA